MAANTPSAFLAPASLAGYRPSARGWALGGYDDGQPYFSLLDVSRMRRDPQVRLGLYALKAPLFRLKWKIDAADPDVSKYVDDELHKVWDRALGKMLGAFDYGHAAGEVSYRYAGRKVGFSDYRDVDPFDAAPLVADGRLAGVEVRNAGSGGAVKLGAPRSFWLALNAEYGSWYGRSRLAGAHAPWLEKRGRHGAVDIRRMWYVKNAYRGGMLRHPPGVSDLGDGQVVSNQDLARQILESHETGATMVVPNNRDGSNEYAWTYEPPASNGDVPGLLDYSQQLDREILIGLGIPPEVIEASETGSGYAGRSVPAQVFYTSLDEVARAVVEAIDKQILRYLVRLNFGPRRRYHVECESLVPADPQAGPPGGGGPPQQPQPQQAGGGDDGGQGGGDDPLAGLLAGLGGGGDGGDTGKRLSLGPPAGPDPDAPDHADPPLDSASRAASAEGLRVSRRLLDRVKELARKKFPAAGS